LKEDIRVYKEYKLIQEKKSALENQHVDSRINEIKDENKVLEIKHKEKIQEVKLNDLKIRELKKQIPNTRLKPLRSKRGTLNES